MNCVLEEELLRINNIQIHMGYAYGILVDFGGKDKLEQLILEKIRQVKTSLMIRHSNDISSKSIFVLLNVIIVKRFLTMNNCK